MKKIITCLLSTFIPLMACFTASVAQIEALENEMFELSASDYCSKTTAGLLGHMAGFLSGYEFVWDTNGNPKSPLPETWFSICNGPYSGNFEYAGDSSYPGYDRLFESGVIGSDDDYHIDIFNQHILSEHGPNVSYYDIMQEWKEHYVHDWGAGFQASYLMRYQNISPPFSGMREYGNQYYWCTEPYIENDTLGMVCPGLPQIATELAGKFGSVTGDFDGILWAKFLSALYSLAYVKNTTFEVVTDAGDILPAGSWPATIYEKCLLLYQTEPDWRNAVSTIAALKRNVNESDNIQTLTDVNNGIVIISLLYGNDDYLQTMKIASLSGYDGDCNAATATGIIGIMKGIDGTPSEVLQAIYPNNSLRYINDTQSFFDPYIKLNYPREQTLSEIVKLYQKNAEVIILSTGGSITNDAYHIVLSPFKSRILS